MDDFRQSIQAIIDDRDHGSSTLVRHILDALDDRNGPLPASSDQRWALGELRKIDPSMVVVHHLLDTLGTEPGDNLPERVRRYDRQWSDIPEQVAGHLLDWQSWNDARVLIHSHSGMILSAIRYIQEKSRGMRFWQTRSLPGGEGVTQYRQLRQADIPCQLLEDDRVAEMAGSADAAWLGADQFTTGHFVNKRGSQAIARAMQGHNKPVFVLADSRKQVPQLNFTDELFEAVPFTDGIWLVTEGGVYPALSLPDKFFVTSQRSQV